MKRFSFLFCLILFISYLSISLSLSAAGKSVAKKKPVGSKIIVNHISSKDSKNEKQFTENIALGLLSKSKQAYNNNRKKDAENYWQQAKAINPKLTKPAWFNDKLPPRTSRESIYKEDEFIEEVKKLPYLEAKEALNKQLLKEPANLKLRKVFYELAKANDDKKEMRRHASIIGFEEKPSGLSDTVKYSILTIILVIIVIEIYKLFKK